MYILIATQSPRIKSRTHLTPNLFLPFLQYVVNEGMQLLMQESRIHPSFFSLSYSPCLIKSPLLSFQSQKLFLKPSHPHQSFKILLVSFYTCLPSICARNSFSPFSLPSSLMYDLLPVHWSYLSVCQVLCFCLPHHEACSISVPWPGIEPMPPAVEVQSLNHWTARKVSICQVL